MAAENTPVQAADEGLHNPEDDPLWSESFYLNFSDSHGHHGGFTRMALHPTKKETEGFLCLYLPGGRIGITRVTDALEQPKAGVIRAGNIQHLCTDPVKQWRVRFDGELHVFEDPGLVARVLEPNSPPVTTERLQLDLEASGLHSPFFYPNYKKVGTPPPHKRERAGFGRKIKLALRLPGEIRLALRMRSGRHYEQSMAVRGSVTLNGRKESFTGGGHRDHSWGLRHWGVSPRFRWLSGQMEGMAFNAMYLTVAGSNVINGYVWCEGVCMPVDELRLENSFDDTGLAGRDISLELVSGGRHFSIKGQVFLNVPLPMAGPGFSTMYTVGRTRYECGGKVGYGVAEFLERLYP